jgi:hypothetical protein
MAKAVTAMIGMCRDRGVASESAGHFQPGYFGQSDIHQDQIGKVRKCGGSGSLDSRIS